MWPDRRLIDLLSIEIPIIQAPMAGAQDWELAAAAAEAGGLGSLPCAMLSAEKVRDEFAKIRSRTRKPISLAWPLAREVGGARERRFFTHVVGRGHSIGSRDAGWSANDGTRGRNTEADEISNALTMVWLRA